MRAPHRGSFRPPVLVTFCLTLCLALAGCENLGRPKAQPFPSFTPRATAVTASPVPGGVQRVSIKAANDRFVPPAINARPGTIDILIENTDPDVHNLTVLTTSQEQQAAGATTTDVVSTDDIAAHKSTVLQVTLTKPGTYRFFCKFHREDGMFGDLVIKK
ncbi:MAG TPA: cupredoxin domain-containing protein [Mycobacteriales bacterium]|nr:cupredoxin domain-containing protein [Mycobacteriales bacterium]